MIWILVGGAVSLVVALAGTPLVADAFRHRGLGQPIRDELRETHQAKTGTPTMGGTVLLLAAIIGYLVAHLGSPRVTGAGLVTMGVFIGMAMVGFGDDFLKLKMGRNLGLNKTAKFGGQTLIAALFAWIGPTYAGVPRNISLVGDLAIDVSWWVFFLWIFLLLTGASNAVNLTDGLDGLVAGSGVLVFGAYTLIAFWQFRNHGDYPLGSNELLDIAIIAAVAMMACAGFLWHNAPPARIIMGDTGSLALGGLLAAIAVATNTQLLLVALGALYVMETLSVIVQVAVFRTTGRRVFRIAPIHHHFEQLGWQETTIIVRFWIVAGIGIALGLGVFYAEWAQRLGPA